jgi:hypothetical protein
MCGCCRRTLLTGERFRFWRAPVEHRDGVAVCELCEARARVLGWERASREPERENAIGLRGTVRLVA